MSMLIKFVNREAEMKKLMKIAESKKAELALIYGRRRVGKSRLLTEFAKKTNALYLLADLSKNILDVFSTQIPDEFVRFGSWDDFFEYLLKSKHKIIIIDEFQYLYEIDKSWPTILQRWWERIKNTNKKIILCGSIISTIYKISMGYGSALYGRKTAEICIEPLKFKHIGKFFPKYSIDELIKTYSVLGGVPRYLEEFDPEIGLEENIKDKVFNRVSFLYNEPMNLLFEEFREPAPYVSILTAITQGYTRFNEISGFSRIDVNKLPKYMMVLERVKLISKEIPVTDQKIKTRNTRYRILDNFYRFWFRFVFREKSRIELGLEDYAFKSMLKEFNTYVGKVFEDVCKEFLIEMRPFPFTKIGRWWHKDKEMDVVALNEQTKQIIFGECKWQERVNAEKLCVKLAERAEYVKWHSKKRKESPAVFAKSFSRKLDEFEGKRVYCCDLRDLGRIVKSQGGVKVD